MTQKHQIMLELNAQRRQELYDKLQKAVHEHHTGKPSKETPALLYEALDAIALLLAGLWVGLEKGVGTEASKTSKRYFRDRSESYIAHLSSLPTQTDKPIIYKQ